MLIPLRGKLLVEILSDSRRTASGLWIADKIEEVPHRGKIVSLGGEFIDNKGRSKPWGLQIGHIVHFKRVWDNEKNTHFILRRDQIYAVEHEGEVFGFSDYVIVKRFYTGRIGDSTLIIPNIYGLLSNEVEFYGDVVSVGADDKMGINKGDRLCYQRNEGLSVRVPLKEELWSLKPRAILAKIG